jgi:hypothetical protein
MHPAGILELPEGELRLKYHTTGINDLSVQNYFIPQQPFFYQ